MGALKPGDLGVTIFRGLDPMPRECADCPFKAEREGRGYLSAERLDGIRFAATLGQPFHCHKTVYSARVEWETNGDGEERPPMWSRHYRQCAGANRYARELARERGIEPAVIGKPFEDDEP